MCSDGCPGAGLFASQLVGSSGGADGDTGGCRDCGGHRCRGGRNSLCWCHGIAYQNELKTERPYLDQREQLEFPNETWAAQEFRKANVLRLAAAHVEDPLRSRLIRRGEELSRRAWDDLNIRPIGYRPIALPLSYKHELVRPDRIERPTSSMSPRRSPAELRTRDGARREFRHPDLPGVSGTLCL